MLLINLITDDIWNHKLMTGSSFITNNTGELLTKADRVSEGILLADLPLDAYRQERRAWGLFRDRRPDVYKVLLTSDGKN